MARALQSRGRRRGWAPLAAVAILAGILSSTTPSAANLASSPFDAGDANLVLNDETKDWVNAPNLSTGVEAHTGALDDSFGQGSKEDTEVPVVVDGSIPPNKSDLTRLYAAWETAGTPAKTFLYLAWERVQDPSGTTNMDFELNQSSTLSDNGVTPVRTPGDVLIKYDLSQGGTNPTMGYHRWIATGSASDCEASNRLPCWDRMHSITGNFEASINGGSVVDPIAPAAPRTLDPRTFGEAAVNLTDTGILPTTGPCAGFASAYLKSRSSDSFTAALKDFIAPIPVPINNCQPATINVTKRDGSTTGPLLAGATLALYNDTTNNNVFDATGAAADTLATVATGSDANPCGPTTTTDATCTWIVTGNGTSNYIIHETVVPTGYQPAPDIPVDVTFTSTAQTLNYTMVDPRAPRDLKVRKTDDDSPAAGVGNAVFQLYKDDGTTPGTFDSGDTVQTGKTCTTASSGADLGNCTISGVDTGFSYWVVETTRPAGYSADPAASSCTIASIAKSCRLVSVPVGSGDIGPTGLTFVNPREFLVITFVCQESTNKLYQSSVNLEGGTAKSSISSVPTALANKGVTEAELCALGGAQFNDLNARSTAYDSDVTISQ